MTDWLVGFFTWSNWAPALSTSAVVTGIGAIVGMVVKTRIEKSIQSRFDHNLEKLRSELRHQEEQAKSRIKRQDDEIETLKRGALTHIVARQSIIDQKKIEAIEKIWLNANMRPELKLAARFAQSMKMEYALEKSEQGDSESAKLREFGRAICEMCGLNKIKEIDNSIQLRAERLHLPPLAWALYSTYTGILSRPAAQFIALREGVGGKLLADPASLLEAAKTALPHMTKFIDENGADVLPYLVEPLEEALFSELTKALDISSEADLIAKAAKIQRLAESAAMDAKMPPIPPGFIADRPEQKPPANA